MKLSDILILGAIYIASIVISCIDIPDSYELFGVKYGETFKMMSGKDKCIYLIINTLRFLFACAFYLLPIAALIYRLSSFEHRLIFAVVYILCIIVRLKIIAPFKRAAGKNRYKAQIDEILDNNPLYKKTLLHLAEHPEIKVVLPCEDGLAFYCKPLNSAFPHKLPKEEVPAEYDTDERAEDMTLDELLNLCCEDFHERKHCYYSLATSGCDEGFFANGYGFEKLSDKDMSDFCYFLSKNSQLGFKYDEVVITKKFYMNVTVSTVNTDGMGVESEYDTKKKKKAYLTLALVARD